MLAPFVLFTFGAILQVAVEAGKAHPEMSRELECKKGRMAEFFDERCCGDQQYTMGFVTALPKYFKDCSVEPLNKTLSLADSQFTFLNCLYEKTTGAAEVTPEQFVKFMAAKIDPKKLTEILAKVQGEKISSPTDNISLLKKLWKEYFAAEVQVCEQMSTDKPLGPRSPDPSFPFKGEDVPMILFLPLTLRKWQSCVMDLEEKYENKKLNDSRLFTFPCLLTASGLVSESDLTTKEFDYATLYDLLVPKHLSQSVKDELKAAVLGGLKAMLPMLKSEAPTSDEISKAIKDFHAAEVTALDAGDKIVAGNYLLVKDMAEAAMNFFSDRSMP